jgi:fructokinase
VLGGAPFNVAWHLQAFGQAPLFVSRVGVDADGQAILDAMAGWGMSTAAIKRDARLPTGRVEVHLDGGQPSYDIVHPCAYDAIEAPGQAPSRLLYHGSLALRDELSRNAFAALRGASSADCFLDVNLRTPWWEKARLLEWLDGADWVKLNDEELALLGPTGNSDAAAIEAMFERDRLKGLLVTYGADGAALLTEEDGLIMIRPESNTPVVDTVGAGDAFAAVCVVGILCSWPRATMLERAQAFASEIVAQRGATRADRSLYAPFVTDWGLNA